MVQASPRQRPGNAGTTGINPSVKAGYLEALVCEGGRRWMSQLRKREGIQPSGPFALFQASADWRMLFHIGQVGLLCSGYWKKCSVFFLSLTWSSPHELNLTVGRGLSGVTLANPMFNKPKWKPGLPGGKGP